ncbi:MAG: DNA primase, partial [Elusimicrobiaceae bacterium]|nr:DNA primase [Elusimicrobiaceae bacterium]
ISYSEKMGLMITRFLNADLSCFETAYNDFFFAYGFELIKEYVPNVKRSGRTYKACCPFHKEKTPSFSISPDKGLFYCFGCQAGGDIFEFLMRIENLSFNEAAKKLAQRAGIEWKPFQEMSEEEKKRAQYYKIMLFAKDFYHQQLLSTQGTAARNYIKERNLTKETTIKFGLGLSFFNGLVAKAKTQGFDEQDLKTLGLANYAGSDYFKNRLMFPIFNHRGEVVAFGARVLGEGQPKYLNSPETPLFSKSRILYGLNFAGPSIRKEDFVILLEGYMDVIGAHQAGVENCVAPLGTSFTAYHANILKRYTNQAVVIFDPDDAGINAALRAALILVEQGIYVRVATLPAGLDPDEFITEYGAEEFKNIAKNAPDIMDFQINLLLKNAGLTMDAQTKTNIAAKLSETINKQPDEIIKREWAKPAADRLNIDADIMLKKIINKPRQNPAPAQVNKTKILEPKREVDLIKILLWNPRYCQDCANLGEPHFENKDLWHILEGIKALYQENPTIQEPSKPLIQKYPELEPLILNLTLEVLPKEARASADIKTCIDSIEKAFLEKRFESLNAQLKSYPAGQVPVELLREQLELQKKLKS